MSDKERVEEAASKLKELLDYIKEPSDTERMFNQKEMLEIVLKNNPTFDSTELYREIHRTRQALRIGKRSKGQMTYTMFEMLLMTKLCSTGLSVIKINKNRWNTDQ